MAVLVRAGYLSADLEIELANRRIPYEKWGGLKFLEAAHIKDMLAFLRLLDNPQDEVSWYRLLRLLPGVGDSTARQAVEALAAHGWRPIVLGSVRASSRAAPGLAALGGLLEGLRSATTPVSTSEEIALVRRFYDRLLMETYDEPAPRLADLDQLEIIAVSYPSRTEFLAALALEPPAATQDLAVGGDDETDALIISTVHSAKGREWDAVFIPWTLDGVYPMARSAGNDDAVEEERRLLYVAMTRARDHLCLVYPLQSYPSRMGADYSYGQLSRFLDEGVRRTMQRVALGPDGAVPSLLGSAPLPPRAPRGPARAACADASGCRPRRNRSERTLVPSPRQRGPDQPPTSIPTPLLSCPSRLIVPLHPIAPACLVHSPLPRWPPRQHRHRCLPPPRRCRSIPRCARARSPTACAGSCAGTRAPRIAPSCGWS